MEFPYQKEKSALFGEILRPLIQFQVKTRIGWITVMGYLDSGADMTLLPLSFAKALGIKIEEDQVKEIRGIGDSAVSVVIKEVEMKIGDVNIKAHVSIALIEEVPYLLGRKDIFNKFRIVFEEFNEKIIMEKIQTSKL